MLSNLFARFSAGILGLKKQLYFYSNTFKVKEIRIDFIFWGLALVCGVLGVIWLYNICRGVADDTIAEIMGGASTALFGMFSAIVISITLREQIKTQREQGIKNEQDILSGLSVQLNSDINSFYVKKDQGYKLKEIRLHGTEAIDYFVLDFCYIGKSENLLRFKDFFESRQFVGLLFTFDVIQRHISNSSTPEKFNLLSLRMKTIYQTNLDYGCRSLSRGFKAYGNTKDELAMEVIKFYEKYKHLSISDSWESEAKRCNTYYLPNPRLLNQINERLRVQPRPNT